MADTTRPDPAIGVTNWMNRAQNIPQSDLLFVSLNPSRAVPEDLIHDQTTFHHPVFDAAVLSAQQRLGALQGGDNTWFAGAMSADPLICAAAETQGRAIGTVPLPLIPK